MSMVVRGAAFGLASIIGIGCVGCNGGNGGVPFGKCGSYTIRAPSADLNDTGIETCSSHINTWGTYDLMGDGYAVIFLASDEYDDSVGWFEAQLTFPQGLLMEEGTTFEPQSAAGMYSWGDGSPFDWVAPSGPVEITVLKVGWDYDDIWRQSFVKLRWKGTWGDPASGPYYTAEAEDWVGFIDSPNIYQQMHE